MVGPSLHGGYDSLPVRLRGAVSAHACLSLSVTLMAGRCRGVAQSWFLPDYVNYTNAQFDRARAQQSLGFIKNNTHQADYNTTVNSWLEQRKILTSTPKVIAPSYPQFASRLAAAFSALAKPVPASAVGLSLAPPTQVFTCGAASVAFDATGAVSHFTDNHAGTQWATPQNPLGRFLYQSFTNEDYNVFLEDFAARIGGCKYKPGSKDDMGCGNFRKPNITAAGPIHRQLTPIVTKLYHRATSDGCEFVVKVRMLVPCSTHPSVPGLAHACYTPSDEMTHFF